MISGNLLPVEAAFEVAPFEQGRDVKRSWLQEGLEALTRHHAQKNLDYSRMVDKIFGDSRDFRDIESLPWLPVRLFKRLDLKSVPDDQVLKMLTSSGTTGQAVSRIFLDRETAAAQTKALAKIASEFIGNHRLPMVIIDEPSFLRDRSKFNARAAGIIGFSTLGRDHLYLLNEELNPGWDSLQQYLDKHAGRPVLLFGFTFIVWQQFVERAIADGISIRFPEGSVLVHGGGWKKLVDRQITNEQFKSALRESFGIDNIHNYYGMVEQVGSIFFECENGFLHAPSYADIVVRDPVSLEPSPFGQEGLIQVLSILPRSYPGHSLLTEDLGTIHGEDDCRCGRKGKYFTVSGRLKNVEMRGCSDTRTTPEL